MAKLILLYFGVAVVLFSQVVIWCCLAMAKRSDERAIRLLADREPEPHRAEIFARHALAVEEVGQ